jgi:hypothetical protein
MKDYQLGAVMADALPDGASCEFVTSGGKPCNDGGRQRFLDDTSSRLEGFQQGVLARIEAD